MPIPQESEEKGSQLKGSLIQKPNASNDDRKAGDFKKAIETYTRNLQKDPNHFKSLFNRGFAFDKLGEYA